LLGHGEPIRVREPHYPDQLVFSPSGYLTHDWSWEYRRKQRRIIRNRVVVITHMGGREAAPWTRQDETRERAIQAAEYRRREIIRRLAQPVAEKTRYPAVV